MSVTIANILDASASDLTSLLPEGDYQAVCTEVAVFANEQDVLINMQKTGEREVVIQAILCFELLTSDGAIKTMETPAMTIINGNDTPTNIQGDKSKVAKTLKPWSGNKQGEALAKWFGSYRSLEGRQAFLSIGHKAGKTAGTVFPEITQISKIPEIPGQTPLKPLVKSDAYVSLFERNKDWFKDYVHKGTPTKIRVFQKKEAAATAAAPVSGVDEPSDEDIPF